MESLKRKEQEASLKLASACTERDDTLAKLDQLRALKEAAEQRIDLLAAQLDSSHLEGACARNEAQEAAGALQALRADFEVMEAELFKSREELSKVVAHVLAVIRCTSDSTDSPAL